jgi:hypothetical protein
MASVASWSMVGHRVYLRLLRWRIEWRHTEPVYKVLSILILLLVILAIVLWRHFGTVASLPVLADLMPILLAVAGIIMSFVQPKKESHIVTTLVLIVLGLVGTAVMTTARRRGESDHRAEIKGLNEKLDAVGWFKPSAVGWRESSRPRDGFLRKSLDAASSVQREPGLLKVVRGETGGATLGDHPKAAIDNHFKTGHREAA